MEAHRFDGLLTRAARQTTRRAALAVLVGGALLLTDPVVSDATKKAKRRKRRKRQARSASLKTKPISLWLDNTAGTGPVTITRGDRDARGNCCITIDTVVVPAGERMWLAFRRYGTIFQDQYPGAYLSIGKANDPRFPRNNPKYWMDFINPDVGLPWVTAAENGQTDYRLLVPTFPKYWCCTGLAYNVGTLRRLNVNEFVDFTLHGLVFNVRRNRDTNYKAFTVTLPAGLSADLEASDG